MRCRSSDEQTNDTVPLANVKEGTAAVGEVAATNASDTAGMPSVAFNHYMDMQHAPSFAWPEQMQQTSTYLQPGHHLSFPPHGILNVGAGGTDCLPVLDRGTHELQPEGMSNVNDLSLLSIEMGIQNCHQAIAVYQQQLAALEQMKSMILLGYSVPTHFP